MPAPQAEEKGKLKPIPVPTVSSSFQDEEVAALERLDAESPLVAPAEEDHSEGGGEVEVPTGVPPLLVPRHVDEDAELELSVVPGKLLRRKIEEVRARLANDDCYLIHLSAQGKGVRKGKSSLATYLGTLIDASFDEKRFVFTPFGFNRKQDELAPGQLIVKDEPRGGQKRRSMSNENLQQIDDLTEWGFRNLAAILIHPKAGSIDRAQLGLADAWVHIHKAREAATWRDIQHRTIVTEDGPKDMVRMLPGFSFNFPDAAVAFPHIWTPYKARSFQYKRTGVDPGYEVRVSDADLESKRKEYRKIRRMRRYEATVGRA